MKQLRHTDETDPGQGRAAPPSSRNWIVRVINILLAALVAGGLLYVAAVGAGPLPPLGPALNPGTGVWTSANTGSLSQNTTLHLPGLHQAVTVVLEKSGVAHISACAAREKDSSQSSLGSRRLRPIALRIRWDWTARRRLIGMRWLLLLPQGR